VQVMDVRHVDGVLEDAPVAALELDLAVHGLPCRVLQLQTSNSNRQFCVCMTNNIGSTDKAQRIHDAPLTNLSMTLPEHGHQAP